MNRLVSELQTTLRDDGYYLGVVNGRYDHYTHHAVQKLLNEAREYRHDGHLVDLIAEAQVEHDLSADEEHVLSADE